MTSVLFHSLLLSSSSLSEEFSSSAHSNPTRGSYKSLDPGSFWIHGQSSTSESLTDTKLTAQSPFELFIKQTLRSPSQVKDMPSARNISHLSRYPKKQTMADSFPRKKIIENQYQFLLDCNGYVGRKKKNGMNQWMAASNADHFFHMKGWWVSTSTSTDCAHQNHRKQLHFSLTQQWF